MSTWDVVIIGSGISSLTCGLLLAKAGKSVCVLDRAEQFGLSQLYQLRGRVGRATRRAYAYFFHAPWRTLTADAQARLEAIAEHTQLGSGYYIAVRDMEIRGAGDFLGGEQSGHISSVGFDMYTRLLTKAVKRRKAEMRGEVTPAELPDNVLIDLPLATYIPTDGVRQQQQMAESNP